MCQCNKDNLFIDFDQNEREIKKKLFKYYPLRDYHIRAFLNKELFFARPSVLNDCFDTTERLIDSFPIFKERVKWTTTNAILLDSHGICSFMEADSVKDSRMWAFYAENFNGFALEFNPSDLNDRYHPIRLQPVTYLETPLDLDNLNLKLKASDRYFQIKDITKDEQSLDRLFQCIHLEKDKKVWASENEWRMLIGNIAPERKCLNIKELLNGYLLPLDNIPYKNIFIGYKISDCNRKVLLDTAMSYGIGAYIVTPKIIDKHWDVDIVSAY